MSLRGTRLLAALALLAAVVLAGRAAWFAYIDAPLPASSVPAKSVAFVLAFENQGEVGGVFRPGLGNQYLADWLEANADRFSLVLTQRAVSDALADHAALSNGVPVVQMHGHDPQTPVRTLEALRCALDRFDVPPASIVLVAHDKQYGRTFDDLASLYPASKIVNPGLVHVPYADSSPLSPLAWAVRELYVARPADALRRRLATVTCPESLRLSQVDLPH